MLLRPLTLVALAFAALTQGALAEPQHNTDTGVLGLPPKTNNVLMSPAALRVQKNPLLSPAAIRVPCTACTYRPPLLVRSGK